MPEGWSSFALMPPIFFTNLRFWIFFIQSHYLMYLALGHTAEHWSWFEQLHTNIIQGLFEDNNSCYSSDLVKILKLFLKFLILKTSSQVFYNF